MRGELIGILESRSADQLAALITRHGGVPLSAPALAEVPDVDLDAIRSMIEGCRALPPKLAIFQTGVGTKALFDAAQQLQLRDELCRVLDGTIIAVRGPKPIAALRAQGIVPTRSAAEPFTTSELLAAIDDIEIASEKVLVQRYGESNETLNEALVQRGASVVEIPTYKWSLPRNVQPLLQLMDRLDAGEVRAVVFTSASQVRNLFAVASGHDRATSLQRSLSRARIVSIGPVCTHALREATLPVHAEASPPKLGYLIAAIDKALA